ncbi:MAG: hypothetical protein IE933_05135 [Sphingomonadales bacterium]|nr:hypothetical protein [Sphingomonadales bacterium]MBD3773091.1 hypothetical protein [Paracoccaceae bacterium]
MRITHRIAASLFTIARWLAGPEQREWIDAMQAEACDDAQPALGWAAGAVLSAARLRAARDWQLVAALLLAPPLALAVFLAVFFATAMVGRAAGLGTLPFTTPLVMALAVLPFAYALGRIRPGRAAKWLGLGAFLAFQALPPAIFSLAFGAPFVFWWGLNVAVYNLPWHVGYLANLAVWIAGAVLGGRHRRAIAGRA